MNILFLLPIQEPQKATFRICRKQAEFLAKRGHSVTVITPANKPCFFSESEITDEGYRVVTTPGFAPTSWRRGGFGFLDTIWKTGFCLSGDYDVVHTMLGHRPAQLVPAVLGRWFRKVRIVDDWWEWYGTGGRADYQNRGVLRLVSLYDQYFELKTKPRFDLVIAISSALKSRLSENSNVVVLNGGVEIEQISVCDKDFARKTYNLDPNWIIIGLSNVGRADHVDNKQFLAAFYKMARREPNLKLFVTGEKSYIEEELINTIGLEQIICPGWLDLPDYYRYLSACDLFVLPLTDHPRNAGRWPHKIGDFLRLERPILTNPTGDVSSLFDGKKLGFLCNNLESEYVGFLEKLIGGNVDLHESCSDSRSASIELSFDNRMGKIEDLYINLLLANRV